MKNISILYLLLLASASYSQIDTIHKKKLKSFFIISQNDVVIKKIDFKEHKELLSIYNPNTKLNDVFMIRKDSTNFVKSAVNFNNNFRNPKIDSFNPYGTSDAKVGLIIVIIGGVFGSIFNNN